MEGLQPYLNTKKDQHNLKLCEEHFFLIQIVNKRQGVTKYYKE